MAFSKKNYYLFSSVIDVLFHIQQSGYSAVILVKILKRWYKQINDNVNQYVSKLKHTCTDTVGFISNTIPAQYVLTSMCEQAQ